MPEGGGKERYEAWISGSISETSETGALRRSRPAGVFGFAAAFLGGALETEVEAEAEAEVEGFGAGKGFFPAVGGGMDFGAEALRASAWVISLLLWTAHKLILYLGND